MPRGNALPLYADATPGESTCYDDCAKAWPPLAPAEGMTLPAGVPGELATIERTDGTQQVTYNDIPLYYFAKDDEPGDTYGQGLGGGGSSSLPAQPTDHTRSLPAREPLFPRPACRSDSRRS